MEQRVHMPLDIQLFADSGEEDNANNTNQEVDDTSKETKASEEKETKSEEKKYTDKELNDISLKNEQKALAKQLKDLGIDDVEKAKSILAKAREDEEKAKSVDEKTQEAIKRAEKATLEAINNATAGDIVLLSPSTSSFDEFSGYEQRGNVFKEIVCSLDDINHD